MRVYEKSQKNGKRPRFTADNIQLSVVIFLDFYMSFCGIHTMGALYNTIPRIPVMTRRKVFLSYHHAGDQVYYDAFSKHFHDMYEAITDNSLERKIDSVDTNYIMRKIRESYLHGSSCTIVLCGANTWRRKYVDWEIYESLQQGMGLVGVWLPSLPQAQNGGTDKPTRLQDNIDSGYAVWTNWSDITSSPQALSAVIETANVRSSRLINNSRSRMLRNV